MSLLFGRKQSLKPQKRKQKPSRAKAPIVVPSADARLTKYEKKRFAAAYKKARRDGKIPRTVQQSIPYREIYPDGVCQIDHKTYSKTIEFFDINYFLAQEEDKDHIFASYCSFLNYFDPSISIQFSFLNLPTNIRDRRKSIDIPYSDDSLQKYRAEYGGIIQPPRSGSRNPLVKKKFLTFSIEAENPKEALSRIERVESDIIGNFQALGAQAKPLPGLERLRALHAAFHPGGEEKLHFLWDGIVDTGLSTKDFIAPDSFHFGNARTFQMGASYGAVSYLQIAAPELSDRLLAELLDMESPALINLHIRSIDHSKALKMLKTKLSDIGRMKLDEQKKAASGGYDIDILPPDLVTYDAEVKSLLEQLQSRNERMFLVTFLICHTAKSKRELENTVMEAAGICHKHNCALRRLDFMQEPGLMSSLPLGINQIEIQRSLTTSSTAIFVPFMSRDLWMDGPAVYYGKNPLTGNPIVADRKRAKNPNALIFGTPGSGKSFMAKREMIHVLLTTTDDILVLDAEAEYTSLIRHFGGQEIIVSPTSKHYVNPMDLSLNYGDDGDPLTLKSDFILSLCELIIGGKNGLKPAEKTILDRCVRLVYREYLADPKHEKMPVLGDLYKLLQKQEEQEAKDISTALEIYVKGSLNVFNHRTNIDLDNRLVSFNIKQLGKSLKKIAMLIMQDQVWNRVTRNRESRKSTWYYIDEAHLLLKDPQTSAYFIEIWKRFRKWGGVPTAMTQNLTDFLLSPDIESIFENSDTIILLNIAPGDREILSKKLSISPHQLSFITHSGAGEGLFIFEGEIIPLEDRFPKNNSLYRIMTTKPEEVAASG